MPFFLTTLLCDYAPGILEYIGKIEESTFGKWFPKWVSYF